MRGFLLCVICSLRCPLWSRSCSRCQWCRSRFMSCCILCRTFSRPFPRTLLPQFWVWDSRWRPRPLCPSSPLLGQEGHLRLPGKINLKQQSPRLRFGCGFESCDANGPQNIQNQDLAKQRFSLLVIGIGLGSAYPKNLFGLLNLKRLF